MSEIETTEATEAETTPADGYQPDEEADDRAETPPAPAPAPPDVDPKFLAKLFEMNREVDRCESEYLAKKEAASAAKKRWEAAQMGLNGFIRKNDAPLFDRAEQRPAADQVVVSDPAPAPEAWRSVTVTALASDHGLSDSIVNKLIEAGLPTVGAIADHTSKGKALTEIPGVGPAKADQIDEALAKFWAAQPPADATPPPAPGPPTAPDAGDGAPDEVDRRPIRGETNDELDGAFGGKGEPGPLLDRVLNAEVDQADAREPWRSESILTLDAPATTLLKIKKETGIETLGQLDSAVKSLADQVAFARRVGLPENRMTKVFEALDDRIKEVREPAPIESDPSKYPVQPDAGQYQPPAKPKRARKPKAEGARP